MFSRTSESYPYSLFVLSLLKILFLVSYHFCLDNISLVLIVLVAGHCLPFTFNGYPCKIFELDHYRVYCDTIFITTAMRSQMFRNVHFSVTCMSNLRDSDSFRYYGIKE